MVQTEPDTFIVQAKTQVTKGCNMTDKRGKETAEQCQGTTWMTKEGPEREVI